MPSDLGQSGDRIPPSRFRVLWRVWRRIPGRVWWVGFDDERVARFDNEEAAIRFAHIDSQLEDRTAVVTRVDPDGTMTVVYTEVRGV